MSAEAVEFKNKGNAAIAQKDWPTALEWYNKAIELDDKQAVFYSNRALVCILRSLRTPNFGT